MRHAPIIAVGFKVFSWAVVVFGALVSFLAVGLIQN